MAVDTARKRLSMVSFGGDHLLVVPDGSIGDEDRYTLLGLYYGMDLSPSEGGSNPFVAAGVSISTVIGIGL